MSAEFDLSKVSVEQMPPTLSLDQVKKAVDKVSVLAEGVNGPDTFSTEAAAYGYIEKHWRLIIPGSLKSEFTYDVFPKEVPSLSILDNLSIMFWNFVRLINGNVNKDTAFFVAAYRARLCKAGALAASTAVRAVTIDEVDFVNSCASFAREEARYRLSPKAGVEGQEANNLGRALAAATSDGERIKAYLEHGSNVHFKNFIAHASQESQQSVIKHLTFSAEQYAASTYLVFRQHGHHYKPEYEQKYNTMWRATTIDQHPKFPGNEVIHRLAVHSFGVKALHKLFYNRLDGDKLAETFVDRADVAPAGTAVIATCWAAINLMKSLPIWDAMYTAYKEQIDLLEEQSAELKKKQGRFAIAYHKNAKLFGYARKEIDASLAASLAPIAKGFIESLDESSDLTRQRALDKHAQQNPVIVKLVSGAINRVLRTVQRTGEFESIVKRRAQAIEPRTEAVPERRQATSEEDSEEESSDGE